MNIKKVLCVNQFFFYCRTMSIRVSTLLFMTLRTTSAKWLLIIIQTLLMFWITLYIQVLIRNFKLIRSTLLMLLKSLIACVCGMMNKQEKKNGEGSLAHTLALQVFFHTFLNHWHTSKEKKLIS